MTRDFETERSNMVDDQLRPRGIKSDAVLNAMRNVPRHIFVPESMRSYSYNDSPLPIGLGQTISQPYIVAFMTEHLDPFPGMKVLEIGTGSGYQTAVLAYLGCEVYTMELLEELAVGTEKVFSALGLSNIRVRHGNGFSGWPEEAPFQAIIVTAAPAYMPDKLVEQLSEGGKMVVPVGDMYSVQYLKLVTKTGKGIIENNLLPVSFVPMVE